MNQEISGRYSSRWVDNTNPDIAILDQVQNAGKYLLWEIFLWEDSWRHRHGVNHTRGFHGQSS